MSVAKKASRTFSYQALSYSQRSAHPSPSFVLFHAPASDIVEWADVDRLQPDNTRGAQRPLRELKVSKIARFFAKDSHNTIPTAIVIALDKKAVTLNMKSGHRGQGGQGTVTIAMSGQQKPGLIIDGQHRVFGAAKYSETGGAPVNLNVVAFLGGDDSERAFQFVVINNSATRVNKDHVKALNLSFDRERLNNRLVASAGLALALDETKYDDLQTIDGTEPFKGLLDWPTNASGFIPPNAVESALAETRERAAQLGIEDLERDVFLAIWIQIRELRRAVWEPFPKSRLLLKVSIWALTVYILDTMVAAQRSADSPVDFTREDVLNGLVGRVVSRIPEDFWTTNWTLKELDTALGRQTLLEAIKVVDSNVRFSRPWYDKVSLVDPGLLAGTPGKPKQRQSRERRRSRKTKE
jgi:DGQHR domain-containing protein